jgi:hypothetical protein
MQSKKNVGKKKKRYNHYEELILRYLRTDL